MARSFWCDMDIVEGVTPIYYLSPVFTFYAASCSWQTHGISLKLFFLYLKIQRTDYNHETEIFPGHRLSYFWRQPSLPTCLELITKKNLNERVLNLKKIKRDSTGAENKNPFEAQWTSELWFFNQITMLLKTTEVVSRFSNFILNNSLNLNGY